MFNFSSKLFRINSLLIFIFLNPLLSHASIKSTGHEIISLRNKISAIAPQVEAEKQRYFKKIDNLKSRYGPRIDELEKQISELIVEKEATRKELENGEYCSQCKRSKSKIERETKKAFHLHLTEVNGVAMPMTPLEIIVEMKKYDDKIEKLRGQLHKLKQALHKAQIAAHDYTDEILLTLELAFKNTKQKLLALAKKFRLEKTEYVVSKAVEDQKWLAGWNLRLQRLNIRARYKGKRALSMVKRLENQALQASNQVDQFDVLDQIKNKIADVQSQYQQDKQSIATLIDRASNQFEKEKLSRIDKRKQSEKDINRLITQVGIGSGVDTLHTLDVSTNSMIGNRITANIAWSSGLDVSNLIEKYRSKNRLQYYIYKRLKTLKSRRDNMLKSLKSNYQNIFNKLNDIQTIGTGRTGNLANAINKISSNWKRDIQQEWTKNTAEGLISESSRLNVLKKSLSFEAIKKVGHGTSILYARRAAHEYIESAFRRRFTDPDEYYEKTFEVRMIDPDTGIAAWYDFTLTGENEGVRGHLNKVFEPFQRMFSDD